MQKKNTISNKAYNSAENSSSKTEKLTYAKPVLVDHGHISELTKFGGSSNRADFFGRRA